jgi:hypothetical protein
MRPGESRRFAAFTVGSIEIGENSLRAVGHEKTPLLGEPRELLRVEWLTSFANGVKLNSTVWVDQEGHWQKQRNNDLGLETFRVTKEEALAAAPAGGPNLLFDTLIKIERPIANPSAARAIRYRIWLPSGNPAELFVSSPLQTLQSVNSRTAEITLRAPDATRSEGGALAVDRPTEADRTASAIIQSEHPTVVAMAGNVAGDASDPEKLATALARHVHVVMTPPGARVDYTQAFATAAEVARDLKGDCSEHAVLLTALSRARNIPARVAIGLVYVPASRAFGYHMWTECWIGDRWLPLDATLGGMAGATHLKIAATSLSAGLADASFVPVARLLGAKPRIEVLAVE